MKNKNFIFFLNKFSNVFFFFGNKIVVLAYNINVKRINDKGDVNMEIVSLKNVKNFNGVRKIETNMNSVVRKGKNINRIQTAENVNNGTYYALPTTVQLNVGNSGVAMVELTPRIIKMIPEGNSRYVCIIEEQTLGAFATGFDNLRKGKFEKVVEKELQRYFNNNNEIRNDYEAELKNKDEQIQIKDFQLNKALSEKQEFQCKYAKEVKEHDDTKHSYGLIVTNLKNEIMTLKEEKESLRKQKSTDKIGKGMWRMLIKIIGMSYAKGDSIDTILEKVEKILEK